MSWLRGTIEYMVQRGNVNWIALDYRFVISFLTPITFQKQFFVFIIELENFLTMYSSLKTAYFAVDFLSMQKSFCGYQVSRNHDAPHRSNLFG